MGVTPGAVSQQIKLLEDRLGLALFERGNREIHLTAAGARLHGPIVRAFDGIETALDEFDARRGRATLTVSTVPAFAASWLVPRLGRFTSAHPDIEVRVEATSTLVDLARDRVDIALRHGLGEYPGYESRRLMAPVLLPVASPKLLASGPPIRHPGDCLAFPLLQDSDRADWSLWLEALGVEDARSERGPSFEDDVLLIRAAASGQGIALVRDIYAREELETGRLALALDKPWPTRFAYYAVIRPKAADRPGPIASFLEWLEREAAADVQPI
jgi:LysR family glycine cleavage system transcriptional activator